MLLSVFFGLGLFAGRAAAQVSPELAEAQRAAAGLLLDRLEERDRAAFGRLRRCPPGRILLVEGRYDHTGSVLRALGLPFRVVSAGAFAYEDLRGVRLVVLDCPAEVGSAGADRARRFAEAGGTLLTTDWAVLNVIEAAFPGLVRYTRRPTRDDVVRVSRLVDDPLLRWVFPPGRPACWWLEDKSFPVEVLNPCVRVLLESHEMAARWGSGVVAFTFRWGRGRVMHVVSHTYLQRNELREPWERRPAALEAEALDLPRSSPSYRSLEASGALSRLNAGDLNAAMGAQQLLLNVVGAALAEEVAPPEVEVAPVRPLPPPPLPPPPVSSPISGSRVRRDTFLSSQPEGERVLRLASGLRLQVHEARGEWLRVSTPAGQSGWVPAAEVE
jgi:hypothetical protein